MSEANCPARYEEDFVEPEEGLPYGNWLRAVGDNILVAAIRLPLQAMGTRPNLPPCDNTTTRREEDIFVVQKENFQVNELQVNWRTQMY